MTAEELKSDLAAVIDGLAGIEIFFVMQNEESGLYLRSADVDQAVQDSLKTQFTNKLRSHIVDNDDITLVTLSSADSRSNAIYHYDLDELPRDFALIDEALTGTEKPVFRFGVDRLDAVKGFVLVLGNHSRRIALYKHHYPISLIKKDSSFLMRISFADSRFVALESDVLKINDHFEFFKIGDKYYVDDIKALEKFCNFKDIVVREALRGLSAIEASGLVENVEALREGVDNATFARKIVKASSRSPVLGRVPCVTVISFISNHPYLRGKIRVSEDGTKVVLHSKKSKLLFLRMLNDDYLNSELTRCNYESLAKDSLDL